MIDKTDRTVRPSADDLINYVEGKPNAVLKELCAYIETVYKAKAQVDYSACSGAPGWNLKYKKSGKPVCTVYPENDRFIMLVTLGGPALDVFNALSAHFSPYINGLAKTAGSLNGTKWLMIEVKEEQAAEDIKKLLELKFGAVNRGSDS